ncbi:MULTISPECIES: hypothetical protein [Oceanobacillus]|uniref:DNA-binding response regulator n=1 Tax=Oceanobacillus kimchii TaxID=746691 RepID=A0ABQ5TPY4_9BACI|nr:hypothetical protein [Oceanobacillus kimchii]GLO68242.1 hypothetical protein MACH08_40260 [Oceanobacillus kimchii]
MNTCIVSHHHHYREGLRQLLEISIPSLSIVSYPSISNFSNNDNALVIIEPLFCDTEKEQRNIEVIEDLTKRGVKVCLITENLRDEELIELLSFPIFGLLFKSMRTQDVILAIKRILKGAYYIPQRVGKLLLDQYQQQKSL